ncbi:hypothetical protein OL233_10440 [Vagococcus sp. PNs007]|uniref:Uncharacterized protein n=1 Tax=Vagococcus proximus TaxID=2991417 RepID=A0ABT5X3W5_9ENTE|nr:hypothetical protein [Vagococcus proximus]
MKKAITLLTALSLFVSPSLFLAVSIDNTPKETRTTGTSTEQPISEESHSSEDIEENKESATVTSQNIETSTYTKILTCKSWS